MAAFACSSFVVTKSCTPSSSSVSSNRTQFLGQTLRVSTLQGRRSSSSSSPLSLSCAPRAAVDTAKVEGLGNELKKLTLEEARSLVDWLQAELGVTAAAFAPAAVTSAAAPAEAAPAVEEKTEFDVIIDEVPTAQRIAVIKAIRSLTTLGLKEAKDLIEGLPKPLKVAVSNEDAEEAKKQLEAAGAKCSIK